MNRNRNTFFLGVVFVFVYVTYTFAGKEFDIAPIQQDQSLWCWAACCNCNLWNQNAKGLRPQS